MKREFCEPFVDRFFPFPLDGSDWEYSALYQFAKRLQPQETTADRRSRNDHRIVCDHFIQFHRRGVDEIFAHWTRHNPSSGRNHSLLDLLENDFPSPSPSQRNATRRSGAIHCSLGDSSGRRSLGASGRYDFFETRIELYHDRSDFDFLDRFASHSSHFSIPPKTPRRARHFSLGAAHGSDPNFDRCADVLERRERLFDDAKISGSFRPVLFEHQVSYQLIISYDGTRYFGWQKAKNLPTIQGEIEKACRLILQEEVTSEAASRTDRGVHARGQVVQLICRKEMNPGTLVKALNSKLPSDIRILSGEKTDSNFHVTLDSVAKTYYYHLDLGAAQDPFSAKFSWHYPYKMDLGIMQTAALEMEGERNFSAFTTLKTSDGLRRLDRIEVVQLAPHFLRIEITGNRFLYKMARTIAGTLAGIGAGKMDLGIVPSLFVTGARPLAGVTAPAHGLTLQRIYYSKENLSRDIIVR